MLLCLPEQAHILWAFLKLKWKLKLHILFNDLDRKISHIGRVKQKQKNSIVSQTFFPRSTKH